MSRQNEVRVLLTATDLISPRIANLKTNLASLGSVPGMQNGLMGSLFGNLGANGAMAALNAVSSGLQNIMGSIGTAAKTQTLGLAEAGDLAGKLGVGFAKAKDLVRDTRMEIVKMAAALPGETEDFTNIGSSLSSTVAGLAGGDTKKYKDMLLGLTEGYGTLGAIRGADSTMGGNALNKLLSGGSTLAEAFNVEIFARNPALREEILKQHKLIAGGKEFKDLSTQTRFEILDAARKKAITQETLASFDGTVDSMIQIMKTNIFNQDVGLFGFLKNIPSMGNRTALDGVQGLMLSLGSLGQNLMPFVNSLGLNSDTFMAGFIGITDWFTDLTNGFNGLLQGENILSMDGVFKGLVDGIKNTFNGAFQGIEKIIDNIDWLDVGKGLSRLGWAIWRGVWQLDWGAIARVLFKVLVVAPVEILSGAIMNTGSEVVEMIKGAFQFIADRVKGFVKAIDPIQNVKNAADFGVKQTVGAVQGIGSAIQTGWGALTGGNKEETVNPVNKEGTVDIGIKPAPDFNNPSPLPKIKPNEGNKQISYNPSFTIAPQAGTDAEGLVALIRNTINNDWAEFKANALA